MKYKRDYYKILGVNEKADKKEIKKAYKQLALEYHPDRNKSHDAERKFKRINEAYTVLSDDKQRQKYDSARLKYYKTKRANRTNSIVKKESTVKKHKKRKNKHAKRKRNNISKYIDLVTSLEEDYGLISGLIGLRQKKGSGRGHNSPHKNSNSTILNSTSHSGKKRHRHRYGKNSF